MVQFGKLPVKESIVKPLQIISAFAILLVFLTGCSSAAPSPDLGQPVQEPVSTSFGEYTDINIPAFHEMLKSEDFTLVNVHIPYEGDIDWTDVSIPYNEIERYLSSLPADKDAKIVLYCRSGRMSTIAAEELVRLGYTNIWQVVGGMVAWQNAGLPLIEK